MCLAPAVEGISVLLSTAPSGANTPLHKIIKALEMGLGYQFHAAWGLVLQVFAVVFEVLGYFSLCWFMLVIMDR